MARRRALGYTGSLLFSRFIEDKWVGYFSRCQDGLEKLAVKPCDILIVDLEGYETEGFELLIQARRMAPWIPTMAIVERAAVPTAVKAVKAGVCECLEKPVQMERLSEAVQEQLARIALRPHSRRALSQTELQILQLILAGKTSEDIAARLHRSRRTIDVHRKNIMIRLLQATPANRTSRVKFASPYDVRMQKTASQIECLRVGTILMQSERPPLPGVCTAEPVAVRQGWQ